jgi:hypothetical protein
MRNAPHGNAAWGVRRFAKFRREGGRTRVSANAADGDVGRFCAHFSIEHATRLRMVIEGRAAIRLAIGRAHFRTLNFRRNSFITSLAIPIRGGYFSGRTVARRGS